METSFDTQTRRRQTMVALDLIDTPRDPVLDGLVRSAAILTGCSMAVISLADGKRQWFKARYGVELTEVLLEESFCREVLRGDALLEVPDARLDPRFACLEVVTQGPACRFYAGVPLLVEGVNVGTLSVLDGEPRSLTDGQRTALYDLGQAVEHWMRSLKDRIRLRRVAADSKRLFEAMAEGMLLIDSHDRVQDANAAMLKMLGADKEQLLARHVQEALGGPASDRLDVRALRSRTSEEGSQTLTVVLADGSPLVVEVGVRPLDEQRAVLVMRTASAQLAASLPA